MSPADRAAKLILDAAKRVGATPDDVRRAFGGAPRPPAPIEGAARAALPRRRRDVGPRHMFIPDLQIKPGVPLEHIAWAARYAANKLPQTIVLAGDVFDMPSLSSYDHGKLAGEGTRYEDDVQAGNEGLALFDRELRRHAPRSYSPRKVVTLGNHEDRIMRAVNDDPRMEGKVSLDDLGFQRYGWQVVPFLKPVILDSVVYAHFFPLSATGRIVNNKNGAPSATAQVRRVMKSCVAGHRQGFDYAIHHTPYATYRGVIAGSYYLHDERYLTQMANYWRGVLIFNDLDVKTGEFSLMEIDIAYLGRRYG